MGVALSFALRTLCCRVQVTRQFRAALGFVRSKPQWETEADVLNLATQRPLLCTTHPM